MTEHKPQLDPSCEMPPEAVMEVGVDGRIASWNEDAARLFGIGTEQALGIDVEQLIPVADRERHRQGFEAIRARSVPGSFEFHAETRLLRADGSSVPVELSVTSSRDGDQRGFVARVRVTPSGADAERSARRLHRALDAAGLLAWEFDPATGDVTLGHPPPGFDGIAPPTLAVEDLSARVHRRDRSRVLAAGRRALRRREALRIEFRLRAEQDGERWIEARGAAHDGPEGRLLVGVARDVTASHLRAARLVHRADHDPLTSLPNRDAFARRLARAIATAREGAEHALCYLDLDGFKVVNDTCGHAAGDRCLRQVARLLGREVRGRDTVARVGGDEFAILMEHCSGLRARAIAAGITRAFDGFRFRCADHAFEIGTSIGVATIDRSSESSNQVLAEADAACYQAKRRGRQHVQLSVPGPLRRGATSGVAGWLRDVLAGDRLRLYGEPIEALGGRGDGIRRLAIAARAVDDEGHEMEPDGYMPAAERHGFAVDVDRWTVGATLDWIAASGVHAPRCAVVLSLPALAGDFIEFIAAELRQRSLPAAALAIDIPERVVDLDPLAVAEFAGALREAGHEVAVERFGRGALLALHTLRQLPVDLVKLDPTLVRSAAGDRFAREILRSIATLAHAAGKRALASGVATTRALEQTRRLGFDLAQGRAVGAARRLAASG